MTPLTKQSTMTFSTCKRKEASPPQFLLMGLIGLVISGAIHGITYLFSPLSLGMGFTIYAGLYLSSLTFFILGLVYNRKGKFRE